MTGDGTRSSIETYGNTQMATCTGRLPRHAIRRTCGVRDNRNKYRPLHGSLFGGVARRERFLPFPDTADDHRACRIHRFRGSRVYETHIPPPSAVGENVAPRLLRSHAFNTALDPCPFLITHRRSGRQAKPHPEQPLRYTTRVRRAIGKDRLQVHRLP